MLVYGTRPSAADKEAAEVIRPAPVQVADTVPPKSLAQDMANAKSQSRTWQLRKQCRLQNCTTSCPQSSKPSCSILGDWALARVGQPCTSPRQRCYRTSNGGWLQHCVCLAQRQRLRHVRAVAGEAPVTPFLLQIRRSQGQTAPSSAVHDAQACRASKGSCGHGAPCPRTLRLGERKR